jgi:hypothetical protein
MPKFIVRIMQDLTQCDTFRGDDPGREDEDCGPTTRELSCHEIEGEEAAAEFYERAKTNLRFAGVAGQYVCFPVKVEGK